MPPSCGPVGACAVIGLVALDCGGFSVDVGVGVVGAGFAPGNGVGRGTGVWVGGGTFCAAAGAVSAALTSSTTLAREIDDTTSIL